jgi:predicted Zn finger-like uncharacterized protein
MLFRTGGGYINWELSGPAVVEVRRNIDLSFGDRDGNITELEAQSYISEVDQNIENFIQYGSARIVRSALLNKDIQTDTEGLMGPVNSSRSIVIHFTFNANLRDDGATVDFGDQRIPLAVFHALRGEPNRTFEGRLDWRHTEIVVGLASLSQVEPDLGHIAIFRGPGIEVLWYSLSVENRTSSDRVRFDTFSVLQCPLELFVVMCVFGAFTLWLPRYFMREKKMLKVRWLHWLMILLVVAALMLFFAGVDGIVVWTASPLLLAIGFILSFGIYSRGWKGIAKPAGLATAAPVAAAYAPTRETGKRALEERGPAPPGQGAYPPGQAALETPPVSWNAPANPPPERPYLAGAQQAPPPPVAVSPRELRCPKCKAVFSVMDAGIRPMAIRCTYCGAEGVLRK